MIAEVAVEPNTFSMRLVASGISEESTIRPSCLGHWLASGTGGGDNRTYGRDDGYAHHTYGGSRLRPGVQAVVGQPIEEEMGALPAGQMAVGAAVHKQRFTAVFQGREVVEVVARRSRASASCFVAPDDSSGRRARAAALPVRLGPRGIEAVVLPELNARDRLLLENAMLL